jgi:hypothetical protein
MSVNASAALMANPIVVYSTLAFYGLLIVAVLLYVYRKFSGANLLLQSLQKDWASADLNHSRLLDQATERVTKLSSPAVLAPSTPSSTPRSVSFDTRNQVIAMGRKGFSAADIARACSMPEADVAVLLGFARIQR